MKKLETLRNSQEFRKVYEQGQVFHSSLFSAFFLKVENEERRIGITVTRKIGNAVIRNRCKRRLREALKNQFSEFENALGFELVVNVKSNLVRAEFSSIEMTLAKILKRFADSVFTS
ncbi:MAG: ribonuclease P protein component [Blastocatellia bacterium]